MITRTELAQDRGRCVDKARGCMLGLAVGDALGDLGRDQTFRQKYGIVTAVYEGAKSTDDTEFALLTARTLIDTQANLDLDVVFGSWQKYILDQGGVYARGGRPLYGAVENIRRGIMPPLSGIDNVMNNDDGAAMRIAPVGVVCAGQPERAAALAEFEAQISHHADGSLLAYMRTGGKGGVCWQAHSRDGGRTWTPARPGPFKNPNSAMAMIRLDSGSLVAVYNDSDHYRRRTPLCVALSPDEGDTWPYVRCLEDRPGAFTYLTTRLDNSDSVEFSYPALAQDGAGIVHVTYTNCRVNIKHAAFDEAWLRQGS